MQAARDDARAVPPVYVAAAIAGNALEVFDFTTYAYFAVLIGKAFFPAHDPFVNLLLSLATFGVGFASRPIGALVLGAYADRKGRRPAMLMSLSMMGAGVLVLALMPPYRVAGAIAPIGIVLARLLQGFALGGEIGPATAFLVEIAPQSKRGFYGSWQLASQGLATLTSGIIGVGVSSLLSADAMASYGWRIPFLFGAAILPVAVLLRRNLPETGGTRQRDDAPPTTIAAHRSTIILGFLMIVGTTIPFYVLSFMTTFAVTSLEMGTTVALGATVILGICNFVFSLVGGRLSDRFGRKPVMIWPRIVLVLIAYPVYLEVVRFHSPAVLLAATALLAMLNQASSAVTVTVITEALPRSIRSLVSGGVYALGVAIFGGTTQFAIAGLIGITGDKLAPALYLAAATTVGLLAIWVMPETNPGLGARSKERALAGA